MLHEGNSDTCCILRAPALSWLPCAWLYAEIIQISVRTPKWQPCLICAGACHCQKTGTMTKTCDKTCDKEGLS